MPFHLPTPVLRADHWVHTHLIPLLKISLITSLVVGFTYAFYAESRMIAYRKQISELDTQITFVQEQMADMNDQIAALEAEDTRKTNTELRAEMARLKQTYTDAVNVYNDLVKLRERTAKTAPQDKLFASLLVFLQRENSASASATLKSLEASIADENSRLNAAVVIPDNVAASNTAPGAGFARQRANVGGVDYLVDIVAADMGSTRVIVDTASDGTCTQDCPVLSLGDYVSRSGAYAGINGSYFCPESYPACVDKKNSFDTLLMNKNKVYFNSDNNVYSSVPAVIFSGSSMRIVGASSEWGRDTGVDAVIANQPMLVSNGEVRFGGNDDPKQGSRGNRSFVGASGSTAYIGVVHGATVAEAARVVQALGIKDAINLDSGGSTALWSGGYKVGPGRAIPNAILFVRK